MSLTANSTGKLLGTATITYGGAPTSNTALSLPGTSGSVMNLGTFFPSKADPSTSNIFVEAWIYLATASTGMPFTVSDSGSEDMGFLVNYSTSALQFRVWNTGGSGINSDGNGAALASATWYHIAGSFDRTNNRVYGFVNGAVGSTAGVFSGTARARPSSNMTIGAGNSGTFFPFNGYITDFRMVNGGIVPTTSFTPAAAPFGLVSPSYASTGATVLSLATQYMQKMTTSVKNPPTLLSSISSGAAASAKGIYSLYAINGTSPIINVRNGTTAATSDFYGDAFGNLTTSAGQPISSWLGAATGFITTWYDQSGLGNHAAQATTALQPSITLGTPNLINFGGTGYFTIANQVMPVGNGVFTTITKLGTHPTASQIFIWNFGTTGSQGCVGFDLRTDYSPNRYEEFFYGVGDVTGPTYTPNATVSGVYNQSSHTLHLNGAQIGTSAVSSRNGIAGNQTIGAIIFAPADGRGTTLYTGTMRDLYVFSTALSTADRNIMENGYSPVTPTLSYGRPLFSQLSAAATSSAVGAYSLRAINGPTARVVQVRRGSDNAIQDFWADRLGNLLTAPVIGQRIQDWLGGATGYVSTWYDQSGAGNHATQTVTGNQPTFNGTIINFTTAANQYMNTPSAAFPDLKSFTVTCRHTTVGNSGDQGIWGIGGTLSSIYSNNLIRPGGGGGYRSYFLGADFNAGSYAVGNIVTLKYNQTTGSGVSPSNGTRTLYVNSSSSGTNATTGWLGNGTGLGFIGRGSFAGAMDGGLYYICMFSTALSDSDRLIVESI